MSFSDMINLTSIIDELYTHIDKLVHNKKYYTDAIAYVIDSNNLIHNIHNLNKSEVTKNPSEWVNYKSPSKPFPSKYDHNHILIRIPKDFECDQSIKDTDLLVRHIYDFDHKLLEKYLIGVNMVLIQNKKLYVGYFSSANRFTVSDSEKTIINVNLNDKDNYCFPLNAIFY